MRRKGRWEGKEIEIGGVRYKVKYRGHKKAYQRKDLAVRGEIDFANRIIELERGLTPGDEMLTLIHEICHGVLDTFIPAKILDDFDTIEELIVDPFTRILVGALRSAGLLKE